MRTRIDASWVVGFDEDLGGHVLIEDGVVVIEDDRVLFAGQVWDGETNRRIEARGKLVSPGFVNTHVHAGIECVAALQDLPIGGGPRWLSPSQAAVTGPLEYYLADEQIRKHMEFGIAHMLKSGSTTFVDVIGSSIPWWLGNTPQDVEIFVESAGRLGARVYSTPGYRSLRSCALPDGTPSYVSMEEEGFEHLERAARFIEQHHGSYDGRVMGMLFPHAVDNTTPALLRATREMADRLGVGIQIHAAQSVHEVETMVERYGRTPIELLADTGVLGPGTLLGHCIFINSHSAINRPGDDLGLVADSGTSVAHSPLKFVYGGAVIESFQRYVDRGVNMTIGTDAFPSDVQLEMRVASLAGKLIDHSGAAVTTKDLYDAATLGGAKALQRSDIGRLSPGAKADVIIVDVNNIDIGPLFDPIRALVHYTTARDIETVMIDGRIVVEGHQVVGVDEDQLMADAWPIYEQLKAVLADRNWNKPTVSQMFPFALPTLRKDGSRTDVPVRA